jgi:hypothetical protein
MAKHVILEGYSFSPSTKTVTINGKFIRREQLLLITNVTTGTVIYNFSDPSLLATTYTNTVSTTTGLETTTVILNYNTTSMSASDKLSILVEETYTELIPSEVLRDPVEKLRVSTPQSLIDTDFEYGTQPTKWETISFLNNRPSAYYDITDPVTSVTNIAASGNVVTVTTSNTTGISAGTPLYIAGTFDSANADGWWVCDSVSAGASFTYRTDAAGAANTTLFDSTKSYVYKGNYFTGAAINVSSITTQSNTQVLVTTVNDHGLRTGDFISINGTTGVSGGPVNGTWAITSTPTNSTFAYNTVASASGTITLSAGAGATLYSRTAGFMEHRSYDGGVQFTSRSPAHGYQVTRQTRRYFRYQSGKGIQFSTGSILKPALFVDGLTSSGTTVTVSTKFPHGVAAGAFIQVSGAVETAYNGTFLVTATTALTVTYTALSTPSASPATGWPITVSPTAWYGSANRCGMFDQQNGFFFEFDGQTLYAVRRSSTLQVSGRVSVTATSQSVTGVGTKFSSQLKPGDFVVIRGQSYEVRNITSDTQMYIYPEYRGTTASACIMSKTVDTRYAQSTWNIDPCNGTGISGYNIDLTKMQMFYIDYSWYGAGAIRFGFKNNRGEVIYAHRIVNNNLNTEAYMRSGNIPARYETSHFPYYTYLTSTLSNTATTGATIAVADASLWPSNGTVVITAANAITAPTEYITYSARSNTALTIAARTQAGGSTVANTFTYSATAPIRAELYAPQNASVIGHWGSSVIMDGRFDNDKAYVFNAGMNTAFTNLTAGTRFALLSVRLAPSVDNGLTGLLGAREIINRMQMQLESMDAYVTGATFRIDLILNGRVSAGTFAPAGGSSLAQVAAHASGTTITGGESMYSFFTTLNAATSQDISRVRDIGNSIIGGGTSLTAPTTVANIYPDGPDIITVCATPIGTSTNSINARISWTEAQA